MTDFTPQTVYLHDISSGFEYQRQLGSSGALRCRHYVSLTLDTDTVSIQKSFLASLSITV